MAVILRVYAIITALIIHITKSKMRSLASLSLNTMATTARSKCTWNRRVNSMLCFLVPVCSGPGHISSRKGGLGVQNHGRLGTPFDLSFDTHKHI